MEDEMAGACGTHCREEKFIQGFGGKSWYKETAQKI
jgi:hypothetical protein